MGLLTIAVLAGGMLLILGGLVGHSLSENLMDQQIREQAALRRADGERRRAALGAAGSQASADNGVSSNIWTAG